MTQGRKTIGVCVMTNYISQGDTFNKYYGVSQAEWEMVFV